MNDKDKQFIRHINIRVHCWHCTLVVASLACGKAFQVDTFVCLRIPLARSLKCISSIYFYHSSVILTVRQFGLQIPAHTTDWLRVFNPNIIKFDVYTFKGKELEINKKWNLFIYFFIKSHHFNWLLCYFMYCFFCVSLFYTNPII